jgi:hypothetical protein
MYIIDLFITINTLHTMNFEQLMTIAICPLENPTSQDKKKSADALRQVTCRWLLQVAQTQIYTGQVMFLALMWLTLNRHIEAIPGRLTRQDVTSIHAGFSSAIYILLSHMDSFPEWLYPFDLLGSTKSLSRTKKSLLDYVRIAARIANNDLVYKYLSI